MTTSRAYTAITPSSGVKERKAFLIESISSLDFLSPPFAEMSAGAELHQFFFVLKRPSSKAEVIIVRGNPLSSRSREHEVVRVLEDGIAVVLEESPRHIPRTV